MAIDIMAAFTDEPPPLDFVFPSFLAGTVGALIAPGAVGKSYWALEAAIAIAGGDDLLELKPQAFGRVVYIALEDPPIIIKHRLYAIGQKMLSSSRPQAAEYLTIHSYFGQRLDIMQDNDFVKLVSLCSGARLAIIDTLSRIHNVDENNNIEMAGVISKLESLAQATECSILFLHHASKYSVKYGLLDDQHAARGASAIIDNARWCGYLAKMTSEEAKGLSYDYKSPISEEQRKYFLRYGVSKHNYSTPPAEQWYVRHDRGVLMPVNLGIVAVEKKKK